MEINKENKIYQKVETPFGWKRNLEFVKESFIQMKIYLTEYRANTYGMLIDLIINSIIGVFFAIVIANQFGSTINWKIQDFLLVLIFTKFI